MRVSIKPDQMVAAGAYIASEWGEYGYVVEAIYSYGIVSAFQVACFDGGRFFVLCDLWGNLDSLQAEGADSERADWPPLVNAVEALAQRSHQVSA